MADSNEVGMVATVARRLGTIQDWCRANPTLCAAVGILLLVVGGLVFRSSTSVRNLFVAVLVALASAAIGGFGLLLVNEPVSAYVDQNRPRAIRAGFALLALGLAAVALAIFLASSVGVIVAAVVVLVALLVINAWLIGDDRTAIEFLGPGLGLVVLATLVV